MYTNMSDNSEMIDLYSKKILEFAGNIPLTTPLDTFSGTATRRSPMCGSNLQVWITVNGGKITNFSHEVKTCALGQASSAIIAEQIIGLNIDQVKLGRDQLFNMLTKNGPIPQIPFENLEVLLPAVAYKNRHASIMLSFEAIIDAYANIKNV
ncbi:iron-sulfur cluster assembly scaffold protein [Amylibacter sp.]|nr:iron-sulfur cluster assembly scaffold protein [Amylibacter sp.]